MITAREMIEKLDVAAVKMFAENGEVPPIWYAARKNGDLGIIPQVVEDKSLQVALVRSAFEALEVRCYAYAAEAWSLAEKLDSTKDRETAKREMEEIGKRGISEHPDRQEEIFYTGEDENGMLVAHRYIVRTPGAAATLSDLKYDKADELEGRMVGLLPNAGKGN